MKKSLQSYKQVKKLSEEILKEKKVATAKEISTKITDEYDVKQLKITPKKISSYLRPHSFEKNKARVLIFKYKD